ncbi:hypothetical protein C2G38_2069411 [Gigaspora rosea]|uniref:PIN domain-containing protein n=1 Tax=Gigaspora rosea TaxID=44941 RepID=A0A397VTK9_9GLOM|nr:hypothetical protein C2G38_2069411 [Gigaspora rosea]
MSTNVIEDRKRLKELISEASDLERELKKQEQEKRKTDSPEKSAELVEESEFLRNSLKDVYEDILLSDLKFANEHNIEEKLWRYVFYNYIEELRQKLRRIDKNEKANEFQAVYLELCRYLDLGTGFYHTTINSLKLRENIDLDRIGIEIFKNTVTTSPPAPRTITKLRRKELTAESIQRCLIRLGDFARYRETLLGVDEKRWEFSKQFYMKAARIYCEDGKAQAQLALLSMLRDNDLDVVYWYCFSLATKQPPGISADNLKVFYTKFSQRIRQDNLNTNVLSGTRDFERKFLTIHRYLFEKDAENVIPEEIIDQFTHLLPSQNDNLQNLGSLLKKIIFILIFTVWDLRNSTAQNRATELRNIESMTIGLGFGFLIHVMENINLTWDFENGSDPIVKECLPAVSIWCQYLGTLMDLLNQLYNYSKSIEKENERIAGIFLTNMRNFFKSFASILNNPKIYDLLGANHDLTELAKYSIFEDVEFLGVVPFRPFQRNLNFTNNTNPLCVMIARLIIFGKKLSKSFDILYYDESASQFTLIDEESKKKERQQRMMKLMAQQRLKDEIDTMENKLQKFGVSARRSYESPNYIPISLPESAISKPKSSPKQCVVDTSVILNHLNSVKNWVADEKCSVIVPLDVIDSLDLIKKGNSQENVRAREAIRFLDQVGSQRNHEHFIRAQKTNEKLPHWTSAEEFLIEESFRDYSSRTHKIEKTDVPTERCDNNITEERPIAGIPQEFRPTLSCWLYFARLANADDILFVTENQELTKYAKMFGVPVVGVGNV